MEYILNDSIIEQLVRRLGEDWYILSFYLELPTPFLDELRQNVWIPVSRKPFEMLKLWRKKRIQDKTEQEEICEALIKCHRRDLTDFIQNNLQDNSILDDLLIKNLSDHLAREWFSLGIYLGLSYTELTNISESIIPRCRLLSGKLLLNKWKELTPINNQVQDLIEAMRTIKRNDLAMYIERGDEYE